MLKIGRYDIMRELGRGAMGIVYEAVDPLIQRRVALKTIRFDHFSSGTERTDLQMRFMREAQSAGNLSHPNIVTIYDVGEDQGSTFISMEFIEGQSLEQLIASRRKLPPDEIISLIVQIADALDYAHRKGVVHRDVKPANILLPADGRPRIVDFGIARIATSTMTQTSMMLGTPAYMAPEQIAGQKVDGRADIFSLGVILYELLTLQKPFAGDNVTTIIYKIMQSDPAPPRSLENDIHPGLDYVVAKALAKDPAGRYQNCREFIADLTDHEKYGDLENWGTSSRDEPSARHSPLALNPQASTAGMDPRASPGPRPLSMDERPAGPQAPAEAPSPPPAPAAKGRAVGSPLAPGLKSTGEYCGNGPSGKPGAPAAVEPSLKTTVMPAVNPAAINLDKTVIIPSTVPAAKPAMEATMKAPAAGPAAAARPKKKSPLVPIAAVLVLVAIAGASLFILNKKKSPGRESTAGTETVSALSPQETEKKPSPAPIEAATPIASKEEAKASVPTATRFTAAPPNTGAPAKKEATGAPAGERKDLPEDTKPSAPAPGSTTAPADETAAVRVFKEPRLIKRVEPQYPPIALQARLEGIVILEATTDAKGRVTNVKVLRSIPMFDQAAIKAVQRWEYEPMIVNGQPRGVIFTVTVIFKAK